jgi:hypothetical protein
VTARLCGPMRRRGGVPRPKDGRLPRGRPLRPRPPGAGERRPRARNSSRQPTLGRPRACGLDTTTPTQREFATGPPRHQCLRRLSPARAAQPRPRLPPRQGRPMDGSIIRHVVRNPADNRQPGPSLCLPQPRAAQRAFDFPETGVGSAAGIRQLQIWQAQHARCLRMCK